MNTFFEWFWSAMILSSIAWYALLLFYVGSKGGREILQMTQLLAGRSQDECDKPQQSQHQ